MSQQDDTGTFFEKLALAGSLKAQSLARFRARWGKAGTQDGWLASRYFDLTRDDSAKDYVDEKTWVDLEFPKIFADLNSTVTPVGAQVLFQMLRQYVDEDELRDRYRTFEELRNNAKLRERIQLTLAPLEADSNASIADFIFGPSPEKPKFHKLVSWWGLFSLITLVAAIAKAVPFMVWLAIVGINIAIIFKLSSYLYRDNEALKNCYRLLQVAEGLSRIDSHSDPSLTQLADERDLRVKARGRIRWFAVSQGTIANQVLGLFNLAFLLEYIIYLKAIDQIVHIRSILGSTLQHVGSLDAHIAVASYLEYQPDHCPPMVSTRPLIEIEQGCHPLVAEPAPNSICLDGRSALIAGSNMAGKTTFIKMIGINVILGRTLGFCMAASATIPHSSAMASIRGEHSVESGKSHYFAEIEAIHLFIEAARKGDCTVFIIDELFNGTNTVERLASVRAVLENLCQNAQVLVTTHDVELQAVLAEHYDLYHFREDPDVEGFYDYKLRSGPSTTRNAIRLLERMDFPSEVVASAMAYAAQDAGSDP